MRPTIIAFAAVSGVLFVACAVFGHWLAALSVAVQAAVVLLATRHAIAEERKAARCVRGKVAVELVRVGPRRG